MFKSTSRFKLTPMILYDGHITPSLMKRFNFLDRNKIGTESILKIEIKGDRAGRPDLVSSDLYGTPLFKWILYLFNNVENPFNGWPQNGIVIEAPNSSSVWKEL